jgi:UDP-N-acetylmuramoyl-tripeptide--D-alanyl-D-alanine ligase
MDAYNANPTSMQASINSFVSTLPGNQYLILGDMLELGPYSRQEHKNILDRLTAHPSNHIFLVGPIFSEVAKDRGYKTFSNVAQLCDYLNSHKLFNGNVLIKGSRGIQLEKILDFI